MICWTSTHFHLSLLGTHLYQLYDTAHGISKAVLARLYSLGFVTGSVVSPFTGPLVDWMGRKRAALVYCSVEILINLLEQVPALPCLLASRMLSGGTTNLLQCVFETWLDAEFQRQKQIRQHEQRTQRPKGQSPYHDNPPHTQPDQDEEEDWYQHEYELLLRDAVIVSNIAAVASGYASHRLAEWYGSVGPFRGAVVCTIVALLVVGALWTENYGSSNSGGGGTSMNYPEPTRVFDQHLHHTHTHEPHHYSLLHAVQDNENDNDDDDDEIAKNASPRQQVPVTLASSMASPSTATTTPTTIWSLLQQAAHAFRSDVNMFKVGLIQGLSVGSLQIFVFLWSPVLRDMATITTTTTLRVINPLSSSLLPTQQQLLPWGLDRHGEPAYGLIFMVFMMACVVGGLLAPQLRQATQSLLTTHHPATTDCSSSSNNLWTHDNPDEDISTMTTTTGHLGVTSSHRRPMAVELLTSLCYFGSACMMAVPSLVVAHNKHSSSTSLPPRQGGFTVTLAAFVMLECLIGIVSPCEGVIRSLYFPSHVRASVWTLPSLLINGAASLAVFGTNYIRYVLFCIYRARARERLPKQHYSKRSFTGLSHFVLEFCC